MAIVIKKRIDLDFLGKDYEGGFVIFKSLSIREVEAKLDEIASVADDNKKSVQLMIKLLQDNFIDGQFVNGEDSQVITADDLEDFDVASVMKFFTILSGQEGDPKV